MATLLSKFLDADQWDGEDILGRLGMLIHAAFLFAGFHPYAAPPPSGYLPKAQSSGKKKGTSPLRLCRWYTASEWTRRRGAYAAVLMLCAQGRDAALLMFLTSDDCDMEDVYRERLDLAVVTPLLSCSLTGTEPWGSRICRSLADGVCWGLLHELCRKNGLQLTGFMSLPDDLIAAILMKLTDGKDLARVKCVSSQLRVLVAERDGELWKHIFEAQTMRHWRRRPVWSLFFRPEREGSDVQLSWKDIYLIYGARLCPWARIPRRDSEFLFCISPIRLREISSCELMLMQDPAEQDKVATRSSESTGSHAGSHRRQVVRNRYKQKWHSVGAIYSPSSLYRWKHR